jgi:diguanylate cyclase
MFEKPDLSSVVYIEGQYSLPLVILSIIIAFGASYTALFINNQMKVNGFFHRTVWLILASLAMGLGIWSMHFIGMTAFKMPTEMTHNTFLTIISAIPAILASFIAFALANGPKQKMYMLVLASLVMGAGISTMHYLGMQAIGLNADYFYRPVYFISSILIAIIASFVALLIFTYGTILINNELVKIAAALVMALAVSSMHYTGMFAIQFYTSKANAIHTDLHLHSTNFTSTVTVVVIGITSLFLIAFLTSRLDRYVNFRIKNFDPLTLLPNQNQFMQDQKIQKTATFVAIIHIQNFEKFISAYGYTYGDEILLYIQKLIVKILPDQANIYRTEANRFTIVMPQNGDEKIYRVSLGQICSILSKPILVEERVLSIEMVCAVSTSNEPEHIHQHFSNAIAVLQANEKNPIHEVIDYNPQLHTYNFERQITVDLEVAMEEQQLFIVYQPKIYPKSNQVVGLEALIRWKHPEYGFISPAKFIPILEKTNKIADLTDWIIESVCEQIHCWNEKNVAYQQVSINIPGAYLTSSNLAEQINHCLMKHQVSPRQIELEITETSVIHDIQNAIQAVRVFRDRGLNVALDDFGTGLSSLSYLKEIPITTIKIDKSFVDGVPVSPKDSAILKAIVELSNSLDLNVVIEGVETVEQVEYLMSLAQVPVIQGYFYSKPLTVNEFEEWLAKRPVVKL